MPTMNEDFAATMSNVAATLTSAKAEHDKAAAERAEARSLIPGVIEALLPIGGLQENEKQAAAEDFLSLPIALKMLRWVAERQTEKAAAHLEKRGQMLPARGVTRDGKTPGSDLPASTRQSSDILARALAESDRVAGFN